MDIFSNKQKAYDPKPILAPVPVVVKPAADTRPLKSPEHNIMEFLQNLSKEIKSHETVVPQKISERIDNFIRKHGNKYPHTTVTETPVTSTT